MTTKSEEQTIDGAVLYADGSFRNNLGGWGIHGYTYTATPLKQGIGVKQLPTTEGYAEVEMAKTVTPLQYVDAFGSVTERPTNNTGELLAAIRAFEIGEQLGVNNLVIRTDSEYVIKNLLKSVKKWMADGWLTSQGEPVKNRGYWETLVALRDKWVEAGKRVDLKWVKGHDGELGNEKADTNARMGSAKVGPDSLAISSPQGHHKPQVEVNPLIPKWRMLFQIGEDRVKDNTYYMYSLSRGHTYGHKQGDSARDKMIKTDLILGRRLAEAAFCVYKAKEPEEYLEKLIDHHGVEHQANVTQLGVLRLDNAFKPAVHQRVQQLGMRSLVSLGDIKAIVTPHEDLISKTLEPPRQAPQAVYLLNDMRRRLEEHLNGTTGQSVTSIDITDQLYGIQASGKKQVNKLHASITTTTPSLDVKATVAGVETKLRVVLGLDIPVRNTLARLAEFEPKVTVLVVADGPMCYSFSTVIETTNGSAIYQCPFTQFVLKK